MISSILIKNDANKGCSVVLMKSKVLTRAGKSVMPVLFVRFVANRAVRERANIGNNDNDNSPCFEPQLPCNADEK